MTGNAVGGGGLDNVARINQPQAHAPGNGGSNPAITQLHFGAVNLSLVVFHRAGILIHQGRLIIQLLLGDGLLFISRPVTGEVHPRFGQQRLIALSVPSTESNAA